MAGKLDAFAQMPSPSPPPLSDGRGENGNRLKELFPMPRFRHVATSLIGWSGIYPVESAVRHNDLSHDGCGRGAMCGSCRWRYLLTFILMFAPNAAI